MHHEVCYRFVLPILWISRTLPISSCIYLTHSLYSFLCTVLDGTRRLCNHISGSLTQHFGLNLTFMCGSVLASGCVCVCASMSVCVCGLEIFSINLLHLKASAISLAFSYCYLSHSLFFYLSLCQCRSLFLFIPGCCCTHFNCFAVDSVYTKCASVAFAPDSTQLAPLCVFHPSSAIKCWLKSSIIILLRKYEYQKVNDAYWNELDEFSVGRKYHIKARIWRIG